VYELTADVTRYDLAEEMLAKQIIEAKLKPQAVDPDSPRVGYCRSRSDQQDDVPKLAMMFDQQALRNIRAHMERHKHKQNRYQFVAIARESLPQAVKNTKSVEEQIQLLSAMFDKIDVLEAGRVSYADFTSFLASLAHDKTLDRKAQAENLSFTKCV
jgi:hypothetical protein